MSVGLNLPWVVGKMMAATKIRVVDVRDLPEIRKFLRMDLIDIAFVEI